MIMLGYLPVEFRNAVLFSLLALSWGGSFVAIEIGLEYVPPLLFAGLRYGVAGLLVLGYAAVVTDRSRPVGRTEWLATIVAGVFVIALYHGLLYIGEQYVSGAVAATVVSTSPILTIAFAGAILPSERLTPVTVIGFVLGLVGVTLVVQPSRDALGADATFGIVLVLAAAAAFALGSVLVRPIDAGLPIETLQAWAMLVGAGVLLGWAFASGESLAAVEVTRTAVLSYGYLTLVSGVLAFLLYFELLDRSGAVQVNLVGYAEPVVAIGISWLVLGSTVDALTVLGLVTIATGFGLIKRESIRALVESAVATDTSTGDASRPTRTDGGRPTDAE